MENATQSNNTNHPSVDTTTGASSTSVATFDDTSSIAITSAVPPPLTTDNVGSPAAELARFFERPVQIATYSWSGNFAATTILPWNLWASNAAVSRKLANYSLFRGTLHIRISVNGTPMQYGELCLFYQPGVAPSTPGSGVSDNPAGTITRWSQLRHVFLGGSGTGAAELIIPFFYTKPYALIYEGTDWPLIGRCTLASTVDLQSCNGGVLQNSTVTIMAWVTDAEVLAPTCSAAGPKRAPNEQKPGGMISQIASTVASTAGMLTAVPGIGLYAKATQIAATAVGSVASIFGFSKPITLDAPIRVQPGYVSPLAPTQGIDLSQKLSVDIKQEVDIGTGSVGLPPGEDELAISNIASRPAILAAYSWATTDTQSTSLVTLPVAPFITPASNNTSGPFYPTPLAFAAMGFNYWTGSLIYRVRVVASPMMTGRLLVTHYPNSPLTPPAIVTTDIMNTMNACVLDINDQTDIEFIVHQTQSKQWLPMQNLFQLGQALTSGINDGINGYFIIKVLNELVAPAPCTAKIIVHVRAGPDFQVASPLLSRVNQYIYSAAGPQTDITKDEAIAATAPVALCDLVPGRSVDISSPYMGEVVPSFRALAKRFSTVAQYTAVTTTAPTAGDILYTSAILPFYPPPPISASTDAYVYFNWANWAAMPFRGMRGGARWKYRVNYGVSTQRGPMTVRRNSWGFPAPYLTYLEETNLSGSEAGIHVREADGAAIVETNNNPFIEVELPYQHDLLFVVPGYGKTADPKVMLRDKPELGFWLTNVSGGYLAAANKGLFGITAIHAAADDFGVYEWVGVGSLTYISGRGGANAYSNGTGSLVTS